VNGFRRNVKTFAATHDIPLRFGKADRKIDVARPLRAAADKTQRPGVVAIGVAQEFAKVFTASSRASTSAGPPQFSFRKQDRRVTCFSFSVWDDDFGPGFVKLCALVPLPRQGVGQRA
jgi:hypothetical protein